MAKKKNIKGYYRMNKITLYLKLRDGMNEFDRFKFDWHLDNKTLRKSLEISLKNDSNESKENWVNLNRRYLCEHERYKYSCRLCKGRAICEHGKQKYYCKICVGSTICQHKRRRYLCKECHVRQFSDPEGRFVLCDIKIDNKILTLLNIYAPNEDKPVFFENIYNNLVSFECEEIILGGDFNRVLDVVNDKAGGNKTTNQKSLKQLESIKENLDLIDIWRIQHPATKIFTWRRRKPDIQCRLDFFLISSSLCTNTLETDILPGYKTDHSLITLSVSTQSNPRGPSFWKLNTSLLSDLGYVKSIKGPFTLHQIFGTARIQMVRVPKSRVRFIHLHFNFFPG